MSNISFDKIFDSISGSKTPLKTRDLAKCLGVRQSDYRHFRSIIKEAVSQGKIVKGRGGKLSIPKKKDVLSGKLFVSKAGNGFVITDADGGDIYVSRRELGGAIHGEKVDVVLKPTGKGKSREGRIVKVIAREKGRVTGRITIGRTGAFLHPTDPRLPEKIEIDNPKKLAIKKDIIASVRLYPWEAPYLPPRGWVEELLGMVGSPGVDIDSLIISHGLPREFDNRVRPELDAIKKAVTKTSLAGRLDLRDKIVYTIDPADAKDHDDAVSVEVIGENRYRLGIHIADVSHYVRPDSALDSEALLRGNSVYLVDRVIPMLPEKLSANICSLHEGKDRLTMSFIAEIDENAKVYKWGFKESVIRSSASLSYEEVQEYLNGKKVKTIGKEIGRSLKTIKNIAESLRRKRFYKGGLDFDLPEPKILLDAQGKVLDIFSPARLESHLIIEELMLLANKYAAIFLEGAGAPVLFRVHDKPEKEKIDNFAELLREMGFKFNFRGEVTSLKLQRVMKAVKGKPEEQFIEDILLRSLAKAIYQPTNIGHFGLAFSSYVHFTSPIRRYPDLLTHRVIRMLLNKQLGPKAVSGFRSSLKRIGRHCTETEIAATQAERESLKIKQLEYLHERVGGIYDGIISGVVKSGLFVELLSSLVEGFVPFASIEDDYFELHEGKYRAVGKRSKRVFKLGDKVRIIVAKVDLESRRADFALIDDTKREKGRRSRKK